MLTDRGSTWLLPQCITGMFCCGRFRLGNKLHPQNHRIMEWFGLEGTIKAHQVQTAAVSRDKRPWDVWGGGGVGWVGWEEVILTFPFSKM